MSVKIRLRRDGAKKRPFYHVVAADERRARNGRFIEELGYYNPIVAADSEPVLVLKADRIRYWLSVGAQPSETAAGLLKREGLLARETKRVRPAAATGETPATDAPAAESSETTADSAALPAPTDTTEAPATENATD